jgi:hypothetical protein
MNSKVNSVKQGGYESKHGCRTWLAFNLSHTIPSWPLYIGGQVTRVNSTNVLDEGLRIGETGRRMNSKAKLVEIGVYRK